MSNGFKIGSIGKIDIRIHWSLSLLLLLSLILLLYGYYLFFIIILLLFACVFIHELAHSITAIRNDIKVSEIDLNIIGGASIIDITKVKPSTELRIALSGPIASIFIGGIFGMLSTLFTSGGVISYIFQLMFEINILLGVFNIIPAFPLDGGRILKSYLQKKRNEFDSSMLAAKISSIVIVLFLFFSIVYVFYIPGSLFYKEFEFFIFLFIAIFMYGGSEAEKETAIIKYECGNLTVGKITGNDFSIISSKLSGEEIYKVALKRSQDVLLIRDNDMFRYIDPFKSRNTYIKNAYDLSTPALSVESNESVFNVLAKLQSSGSGIAVILKQKKPIGIITVQRIQSFIYLHMLARKTKKNL